MKELDLNPVREENESFEDYKVRRREAKEALKEYLKGKPVFIPNTIIEVPVFEGGKIKYNDDGQMETQYTRTPPYYLTKRFGPLKGLQ